MELFAQDTDAIHWLETLVQLAQAGGFGALVWYFVVKHFPAIEARHAAELERRDALAIADRKEQEERHRAERDEWRAAIVRIETREANRDA